ncbi:MAG: hypothetical protein IPK37_19145 [Austwickia sp.]|jgi:hypothetical protein|nr:MAG: hypothetical protein IPK37_19145 [Austwickia sp.]
MSVLDSVRIESAVQRYDLALDLYGVAGRRRRELRRELRGNLHESAQAGGASKALAAIGSPEQLARESAAAVRDPRRPAWSQGFSWALVAVVLYWLLALWSAFAFMDGVFAADVPHEVTGPVTLLPGVVVHAHERAGEFGGGLTMTGPFWVTSLVVFLVVLALAGRVWRPLRRTAS